MPRHPVAPRFARRGPLAAAVGVAVALVALADAAAASDIKTRTLDDGSTLIYNETPSQRARRTAEHLLPVPRQDLAVLIGHHARQAGLSELLVQAVVQVESGYNPVALSRKGAMGLMQLMPGTAEMFGVTDAYDADQNLAAGTRYLRQLLDLHGGDTALALACYNAGPTAVARYGGVPPYRETEDYVRKVLTLYRGTPPPLLREHAQAQARRRTAQAAAPARTGSAVYLDRDAAGNVLFTTRPPKNR